MSDLWRAVKDTDESVRLLAQGLNILTDQQNIQVEFLRKIFDLVRAMQPVLNETHEAVTAPAPPSPVADALAEAGAGGRGKHRRVGASRADAGQTVGRRPCCAGI